MKDRYDDPSHHERTLLPPSYKSLQALEQLETPDTQILEKIFSASLFVATKLRMFF